MSLRLFAGARDAAGVGRIEIDGGTVAEVIEVARQRFGDRFADVAATSTIWVNGEAAEPGDPVASADEVAVLPPVSGGAV